jgi:hypothetical protein
VPLQLLGASLTPDESRALRITSERRKIEPITAHSAFLGYYFRDAMLDERLTGRQRLLLLELSILAADASGGPLGYTAANLATMFAPGRVTAGTTLPAPKSFPAVRRIRAARKTATPMAA